MNKFKFVLKGENDMYSTNLKGDINTIIASLMQYICEITIDVGITKKEFLERCKKTYELTLKMLNESEEE